MSRMSKFFKAVNNLTSAPEMDMEDRKALRSGIPAIAVAVGVIASLKGAKNLATIATSVGTLSMLYFRNRAEDDIDYMATKLREREIREHREAQAAAAAARAGDAGLSPA